MAAFVDNLWGWEVSNPELVDDIAWQETYELYVNEDMNEWFNANNAEAYHSISGRMIEAIRKGYWKSSDEVNETLCWTIM